MSHTNILLQKFINHIWDILTYSSGDFDPEAHPELKKPPPKISFSKNFRKAQISIQSFHQKLSLSLWTQELYELNKFLFGFNTFYGKQLFVNHTLTTFLKNGSQYFFRDKNRFLNFHNFFKFSKNPRDPGSQDRSFLKLCFAPCRWSGPGWPGYPLNFDPSLNHLSQKAKLNKSEQFHHLVSRLEPNSSEFFTFQEEQSTSNKDEKKIGCPVDDTEPFQEFLSSWKLGQIVLQNVHLIDKFDNF